MKFVSPPVSFSIRFLIIYSYQFRQKEGTYMSRDSATVSNNMRKIHSKDTSIELLLRKALWHKGYRYRKNYKALPGSPDIVVTKYKIAIFCDSEFFHGKDWEILKLRLENGKNPDFWIKKIERNRNRDYENDKKLLFLGYTVLHFWGQDISKHTDECLQTIEEAIWDTKFSDTATDYDISEE
jgi:DNA mismatch endonuclease (patch repair protein)